MCDASGMFTERHEFLVAAFFYHQVKAEIASGEPSGHLLDAEWTLYLILWVQIEPLVGIGGVQLNTSTGLGLD